MHIVYDVVYDVEYDVVYDIVSFPDTILACKTVAGSAG
jgi:hypothetical protein